MNDKIEVKILERSYTFATTGDQTGIIVRVAEMLDQQARQVAVQCPRKDQQDLVAIAAILSMQRLVNDKKKALEESDTKTKEYSESAKLIAQVTKRLEDLDKMLDEAEIHS